MKNNFHHPVYVSFQKLTGKENDVSFESLHLLGIMNKTIKQILSIILLIITIFSNISPVLALTFEEGQTITLQKDHDCISLLKVKGKDMLKGVTYVMYYNSETGEKQPAFCVQPEKEGIGTGAGDSYDVTLSSLNDERLWRILYKGYMGSSYMDWGLEYDDDLYYATKTAVHSLMQDTAPNEKYEVPTRVGWGEDITLEEVKRRGGQVLNVAQQLYEYGLNGSENYKTPQIYATKNGEVVEKNINGEKYLVQNYTITGNRTISTYKITIENFPKGTKILNNDNAEVTTMSQENFKIAVPTTQIIENIEGNIHITEAKVKTYPVFYATAYSEEVQNYITYATSYEETSAETNLSINAYKSGLKITKIDADTKTKLSGVTFNVKYTDTAENIGDFTTNNQGLIEIAGLRQGKITVTETKTGEQYVLDTTPIDVTLQYNQVKEITIDNKTKRGNIKIVKIDSENNEIRIPNVEFELLNSNKQTIGKYTTDSNGEITISNLKIGTYYIKETKCNENYYPLEDEIKVEVKWNETTEKYIKNEIKKGQVKVIKIDKDNNEIRIPEVTFNILDESKKVVDTITTDKNGEAVSKKLPINQEYTIVETKTLDEYVLSEETKIVKLKCDQVTQTEFTNEKKKGQIKVIKVDEDYNEIVLEGIRFEVIDSNDNVVETLITDKNGEAITSKLPIGKYRIREVDIGNNEYILDEQNIIVEVRYNQTTNTRITNKHKMGNVKVYKIDKDNNKIALGNVEFDLYSEEFGKVVGTYLTDVNGVIYIDNLRIGKYKLIEKQTNQWYDLADETEIKVEWDTTINKIIENELKKGQIKVVKVDKENNEIKIAGAVFEVLDENGVVLETITTNEDGEAVTDKYSIRDYETLTIREISTNDSYVLEQQPQTIKLQANQIQEITIGNRQKRGKIKIIKVDKNNNEIKLEGVIFEIYNKQNQLVDTLVTNKDGEAISKELYCNDEYTIKEVETKEYYILNEEPQTVVLEQDEIKEIKFENEPVEPKVHVEKEGIVEAEAGQNIYYDFKNIQNNSNVSLEDFTWSDQIPTDALRIDKLITGTWNEKLTYSVWYKTNKNEFKLLQENLSTEINHEIDFKQIKLEEDEYITNYELRFGTVKPSFSEVEQPRLYCNVLENLENGYKFINTTNVKGRYKDKPVQDEDNWTTIIYNKEPEKEILPRTGM